MTPIGKTGKSKRNARYYQRNKERLNEVHRQKYLRDKERIRQQSNDYRRQNIAKVKATKQARYRVRKESDPKYAIKLLLRSRVRDVLMVVTGARKAAKTMELVGCTAEFLKGYLEARFSEGMTWKNRGVFGWHIDHVKPCDSFDLTDPDQQRTCFHYTNLQPLWWWQNLSKGRKHN